MPGSIRSWVILISAAAVLQCLTTSAFMINSINCTQRRGKNRQEGILQCQHVPAQESYKFSYWQRHLESEDSWAQICQCLPDNHCSMFGSSDNFSCEATPGHTTLHIHNITKRDQELYKFEVTWENKLMEVNLTVNLDEMGVEQSGTTYPVTEKPQKSSTEQPRTRGGSSFEIRAREVELPVSSVLIFTLIGLIMVLLVAVITYYVKIRKKTEGEEMKPETERLHIES